MNFKPMFDRVLVKQDPAETTTRSGFIIPDSTAEKTNTGTVVAVGPGKATKDGALIPLTVQPADKIMYTPGNGIRVKVEGVELLVLKEEEIIAVIDAE
jgi:chaperonin GroES